MCKFSEANKDKLGNALIYMAERVPDLSKTKALKLLYLMEERMALRYHVPFLGIPYEVWQAGPVAKDVFIDLSDGPYLLKDYIKTESHHSGTYIVSVKPFCDDEFSDCEIEMMDEILRKYGKMTASELVEETHKKGTLWYLEASQNGLMEAFRNHECNNSDLKIDFTKAMTPCAAEFYQESLDFHQTANLVNISAHVGRRGSVVVSSISVVYGANLDMYSISQLELQERMLQTNIELIGNLDEEVFADLKECLSNSKMVKNKFRRLLK